jgi:hypothetical protein
MRDHVTRERLQIRRRDNFTELVTPPLKPPESRK